jgi:hypothetical protein
MLLPCPFCGQQLTEKGDVYLTWSAHVEDSTCLLRLVQLFDEADRQAWNRRVATLGDFERLLSAEMRQKIIAEMFLQAGCLEELPLPVQDYVIRNKEESFRDGWELGFIAGCSKAVFRSPSRVEVTERFAADASLKGFRVGDTVEVAGGDGLFEAEIVAAFPELWGTSRFVVEDRRGVLHIYGGGNLRPAADVAEEQPVEQVA